jgi:putative acetyltransferase
LTLAMDVRDELPGDRVTVGRVVTDAFGEEGRRVASLVEALAGAGHVRASLVAVSDGDLVGHVQLNRSWVDARERLVEVLVLSPLSVAPAVQRRGVGTELVEAALRRAESLGAPAVFLEGDPSYYGRRGFGPGAAHGFVRPSARIPEPAFQVATLPAHEPWMTGALVYCEAFWTEDCVGLRDPTLNQIEHSFEHGV